MVHECGKQAQQDIIGRSAELDESTLEFEQGLDTLLQIIDYQEGYERDFPNDKYRRNDVILSDEDPQVPYRLNRVETSQFNPDYRRFQEIVYTFWEVA